MSYDSWRMEWVPQDEPTVQRQRGKWTVRQGGYDPSTGRRKVRQLGTFDTKRAATELAKSVAAGRAGSADETVEAFVVDVWLRSKEGRVEQSTLDQYRWAVERHIVPLIGAVRLRDLAPEILDDWIVDLNGAPEGEKPRLGATSTRLVRKVLSMALEEAVQRGRLGRNPVALTQPPRAKRATTRKSWTVEEAKTFLAANRKHRLYALFHLGLVTGLRRGELLGLRWTDLDLEHGTVEVAQQLAVVRGRPVMKDLKTESSDRILAIGQRAVEVLEEHRTRQAAEHVVLGLDASDVELVFTSEVGGWIDPNNLGRIMERLAKDAGVPRLTPKGLRHTAQSIGRVVVGDDKIMQERLGHSDIGITLNTYTHTVSEQHRRAGDLIDGVFE
jgi:integrase